MTDTLLFALLAAADQAHGGEKSGLPQFDVSHFPSQIFWLAVSFVLLLVVMWRVTLPRLAGVIEERRDRITDDLDAAEEMRRRSEEANEALAERLSKARAAAADMLNDARARDAKEAEIRKAESEAKAAEALAEANERIDAAKKQALASVTDAAAEAARLIAERVAGADADEASAKAAVKARMEGGHA